MKHLEWLAHFPCCRLAHRHQQNTICICEHENARPTGELRPNITRKASHHKIQLFNELGIAQP